MKNRYMRLLAGVWALTILAIGYVMGGLSATAHTPCNDYEPPKTCKYVNVINPYTGKLQQEYVCD